MSITMPLAMSLRSEFLDLTILKFCRQGWPVPPPHDSAGRVHLTLNVVRAIVEQWNPDYPIVSGANT